MNCAVVVGLSWPSVDSVSNSVNNMKAAAVVVSSSVNNGVGTVVVVVTFRESRSSRCLLKCAVRRGRNFGLNHIGVGW